MQLLHGDQRSNHNVTRPCSHDVRSPWHNSLPSADGKATAYKLHRIEAHLDAQPDVPPGEDDGHERDGQILEQILPTLVAWNAHEYAYAVPYMYLQTNTGPGSGPPPILTP